MQWGLPGAIVGAALAGLGLWLGHPEPAAAPPPPPTTQVSPVESAIPVSLGPTRLVPVSLALEDGEVAFSYELIDEAPPAGPTIFVNSDVPVVAPQSWTLHTVAGPVRGETTNIRATTARFTVAPGTTLGDIGSITLEAYQIRLPVVHELDLPHGLEAPVELEAGLTIGIRRILEQRSSTLVQLTVHSEAADFASAGGGFGVAFESGPRVSGRGPGWTNIGPVTDGVQLTFVGDLPDPIPIAVATTSWARVERQVAIAVGGLADG